MKLRYVKAKGSKVVGTPYKGDECYLTTVLANQLDFLEQECEIAVIIRAARHLCLFLPKFYYELNIIEFF